jgi:hypothetical protein
MKLCAYLVVIILFSSTFIHAQVKVGDNPTTINPNSILELESANQGLLMPRVTLSSSTSAAPLTAHIQGMTVYNTASVADVVPGFYYNDGSKWVKLARNFSTVNGLHINQNNQLMLGGQLSEPTAIGTDAVNTLALTGLSRGNAASDEILTIDPLTGVVSKLPIKGLVKEMETIQMASEGQTQFNTPIPVSAGDKINVYRNGVRIGSTIINANTIALESGVVSNNGDEIRIVQFY